ncbi:uncharacterized protein [Miscanthus floridulus]|uniref:uncharacterized protein n=1 Tax=Miscanthus floridulus TaxID=154761 RepID=UPI00345B0991
MAHVKSAGGGPGDEDPRRPPRLPTVAKGKATKKRKYPDADIARAAAVVVATERVEVGGARSGVVIVEQLSQAQRATVQEEEDVAEIYVEGHAVDDEEEEDDEDNNFEDEIEGKQEEHDDSEFEGGYEELTDLGEDVLVAHNKHESREDVEKQIKFVREWYNPSKMDKGKQVVDDQGSQPVASQQNISSVLNDKDNLEDNSDSEFLPGDDNSSEEDEEVVQIQKKFKKSMNSGQVANLDDVILDRPISGPTTFELNDDANDTPYANSSAEDESEEEASEGHLETKNNFYPRFKKNVPSPRFVIFMKFTRKKQFKKAVIRQSLLERRVIKFRRNESHRMLVLCDWATCT